MRILFFFLSFSEKESDGAVAAAATGEAAEAFGFGGGKTATAEDAAEAVEAGGGGPEQVTKLVGSSCSTTAAEVRVKDVDGVADGGGGGGYDPDDAGGGGGGRAQQQMPPASVMTRLILIMVWRKLIRNPNTYSSLIGLAWSLIAFRYATPFHVICLLPHSLSMALRFATAS